MGKEETIILNSKLRDSGGKKIFEDPLLCAQFLRDYIKDIPCFKNIGPDDIEDVSGQFVPMFAEERNSDSVKRIRIKDDGEPFFVISLIEHKSYVEYNVCMQIFRYMIYIWEAYEKEMESRHKGISHLKDFRYPPILPIVYYEGSGSWEAPLDFQSRILSGELFSEYLPNFKYYLVQLNEYSNGELLEKNDEISLVMMINKLQSLEDIRKFREISPEKLQEILAGSPDRVVKVIADILLALLLKINVPTEQAEDIVAKVREKKMGLLFENFEPVDIQEEWRKLDIAKAEIKKGWEEIDKSKKELDKSKEEINRDKEEINRDKEEINRDKEEINRNWDEITRERKELKRREAELKVKEEKIRMEQELRVHHGE